MIRQKIRVAVLGAGAMGQVHAAAFSRHPDAHLVVVADPDPATHGVIAAMFPTARITGDPFEALSAADVDFVSVAGPPATHYQLSMAALDAHRHVLCEKPLALDASEAEELVMRAERSDRTVAVAHQLRFNPARKRLRELISVGTVGPVRHVTIRGHHSAIRYQDWTWWADSAQGGGMLNEYGSHDLDLLQWIFGPIDHAQGLLRTFVAQRRSSSGAMRTCTSDDYVAAHVKLRSGVIAAIELSGVATHDLKSFEVQGTHGRLLMDGDGRLSYDTPEGLVTEDCAETSESLIGSTSDTYTQPFARLVDGLVSEAMGGPPCRSACRFSDGASVIQAMDEIRLGERTDVKGR